MSKRALLIAVLGGLVAIPVTAQPAPPRVDVEHRAFDFWIGDWDVTVVGSGQVAGTNEVTSVLGGCALLESYETPTGYRGNSYNIYDRASGSWHQTWVDNAGTLLQLDGGIVDGKMVLSGPGKDAQGNDIVNRITWTSHEDGSVQQTWDVSSDGGDTWTNAFDGMYRRKSGL
ncbi:MAG: DUF1579 domain-containing protein [Gemmatimonadota bacterium]|nr:DUF1579 domain-containing protein [Gemmatimonadota bacterium]